MTATIEPAPPAAAPHAEPAPPAAAPRAESGARLPEILIQALFTLVAVVLAFAVEEWREERELDHIATEARAAIVQEIQHNLDELLESRQDALDTAAALQAALDASQGTASPALGELVVNFELALLSSAAWRSVQSMESARRMEYAWMLQAARAYELQGMYEQAQWAAVEANTTYRAARDDDARAAAAQALLARMRLLSGFSRSLEGDYVDIL